VLFVSGVTSGCVHPSVTEGPGVVFGYRPVPCFGRAATSEAPLFSSGATTALTRPVASSRVLFTSGATAPGARATVMRRLIPAYSSNVPYTVAMPTGDKRLALNTRGVISGTVLDSAGNASYNTTVALIYRGASTVMALARTASDGTYSFTGLDATDLHSYTVLEFDKASTVNALVYDLVSAS